MKLIPLRNILFLLERNIKFFKLLYEVFLLEFTT